MNKLLVFFVAGLTMLATGCSNELAPEMPKEENVPTIKGKVRSADEAIAIAMAAKQHYSNNKSRASFTVKDIKCYGTPATRSGLGADSLYYIVNFDDEQGYAVIGADRRIESVIAVIDEGNFSEDNIEQGSSREYMYNLIQDYSLAQTLSEGVTPVPIDTLRQPFQFWVEYCDTLGINHERMLYTRWRQGGIYAKYAGSLYDPAIEPEKWNTGCTPLAMCMAMSYFKKPSSITITFDDSNRIISPNWDAMLRYDSEEYLFNWMIDPEEEEAKEHIALVVREIAQRAGAKGNEDGSVGTDRDKIPQVMAYFGFNCWETPKPSPATIPKPSIDNNTIIICSGRPSENAAGHTFVIDGVDYLHTETGLEIWEHVGIGAIFLRKEDVVDHLRDLVHINWGWGGQDNGYYTAGLFLEASYRELDKLCIGTDAPYKFKVFKFFSVKG